MHRAARGTVLLLSPLLGTVLVGCAGSAPGPPARTSAPSPQPTRTIVENTHVVGAGRAVVVRGQAGVAVRLLVSSPRVSRTSLSSSYGYPPQHGRYLTFRVTVANIGTRPIAVRPRDFAVRIAGEGQVTSYDGNAPYSGAGAQLDSTGLDPGQRVRAPLTFDVRRVHGRFVYAPDRSAAAAWRF